MTEKIKITERTCRTCEHERKSDSPIPCDACYYPYPEPRNWSPRFVCPGDCETAVKLLEERATAWASVELGQRVLRKADEDVARYASERDAAVARAEKAEAEVARLKRGLEKLVSAWRAICEDSYSECASDCPLGIAQRLLAGEECDGGEGEGRW